MKYINLLNESMKEEITNRYNEGGCKEAYSCSYIYINSIANISFITNEELARHVREVISFVKSLECKKNAET